MKYEIAGREGELYRVRALRDIRTPYEFVTAGTLGGLVADPDNFAQDGNCWLDQTSRLLDHAELCGDAYLRNSVVMNDATIRGQSRVHHSVVWGWGNVLERAMIVRSIIDGDVREGAVIFDSTISGEILESVDVRRSRIGDGVELRAGRFCRMEIADQEQVLQVSTPHWGLLTMAPGVNGAGVVFTVGCQVVHEIEELGALLHDYVHDGETLWYLWPHFKDMAKVVSERHPFTEVPQPSDAVKTEFAELNRKGEIF